MCGDRVREGARKGEERSPRRGSAVAGPDRGLVEVLRTGTVVGPSRRDVGRTKQREHLRIQPTPTSPFQNQPLRPFKSTTTFLLSHSKTPRIQLSLTSHSTLRIVPCFIDHGVRGGAMAKPTSLSVPIGPGLHVVRLSGRVFRPDTGKARPHRRVWV